MTEHNTSDYESSTALINDLLMTGVIPSDAELQAAAANLSSDYAITFSYAADVGVGGPRGVEGTRRPAKTTRSFSSAE